MTVVELQAQKRDPELNPRQLRAQGIIPATIYGPNFPAQSIQVEAHKFTQTYLKGSREYKLSDLGVTAKAHQVQAHTTKRYVQNIEFLVK